MRDFVLRWESILISFEPMEVSVKVLAILNLLGAVQGILLAIALLSIKRGNRRANRLLAAFVATTVFQILGAILFTTKSIFDFPHLSRLHHPFLFLTPPLLYLYIRELTARRESFNRKDLLHFLPFLFCALYLAPYFLRGSEYKIANLASADYAQWYFIRSWLAIAQGAIYLYFILGRLADFSRNLGASRSPGAKAILLQARVLVGLLLLVFFGGLIRLLLQDREAETNLLLPLCGSIMVYAVAWMGLTRPEALAGYPEETPKKYERSTLTPSRAEEYLKRLLKVMETEKPWTDGDLTLQKLAERIAMPAPHLSQLINERIGQNFSDFINGYRVEEAKLKLRDPAYKHYSILAIAEEVGFNSKSSFNAAFKKHAQMAPSVFRDASGNNN
jgi:AraC-like DNA-binding protein